MKVYLVITSKSRVERVCETEAEAKEYATMYKSEMLFVVRGWQP